MTRKDYLHRICLNKTNYGCSGIAGGVVSQPYFQRNFGMLNPDGSKNTKRTNDVSSNVVSVLQAGAFFGALGSAPISNRIGRRWTLVIFSLIFTLGAVSNLCCNNHRYVAHMYTDTYDSGWRKSRLALHIRWPCYIRSRNWWHIGRCPCLRL